MINHNHSCHLLSSTAERVCVRMCACVYAVCVGCACVTRAVKEVVCVLWFTEIKYSVSWESHYIFWDLYNIYLLFCEKCYLIVVT